MFNNDDKNNAAFVPKIITDHLTRLAEENLTTTQFLRDQNAVPLDQRRPVQDDDDDGEAIYAAATKKPPTSRTKKPSTSRTQKPKTEQTDTAAKKPVAEPALEVPVDKYTLDKLHGFVTSTLPPRVVHNSGCGAFGYFEAASSMAKHTRASVFSKPAKKTDVFVRFSPALSDGAVNVRDIYGMAVRFFTSDGNYDILNNSLPAFFLRDASLFKQLVSALSGNNTSPCPDPDIMWDFFAANPQTAHAMLLLFSNRAVPPTYRHINGYSVNSFMWYADDFCFVKYHFVSQQNTKKSAPRLSCDDYCSDLYNSIKNGDFPAWEVYAQIMSSSHANDSELDPFDATKVWYKKQFPRVLLGKLVLNRNVENIYDTVEKSAFSPANLVDGVALSPDKLLHARHYVYYHAQQHRLGDDFNNIEINKSKTTASSQPPQYTYTGNGSQDNFCQPRELYQRVMTANDRADLSSNIAESLSKVSADTQQKVLGLLNQIDPNLSLQVTSLLKSV